MKYLVAFVAVLTVTSCQTTDSIEVSQTQALITEGQDQEDTGSEKQRSVGTLELGNFSVSLAVKDLAESRAFYEKLGFEQIGGEADQNWLILQNGTTTIGLFQDMFERNIMTFNPGWTKDAETLEEFTDVREIQRHLKKSGLTLMAEADESTTGPASLMLVDPDGNPILFDQHVE